MVASFSLPDFCDCQLLQQALTHSSYCHEHPEVNRDNERLEFLGDAVLTFLSGDFLYKRYPNKPEGDLTVLRSALVDEQQLAQFATWLNLGKHMRLSRGASHSGGRQNPNLLSSTFEALIGAYFLDSDSDIEAIRAYVLPFFDATIEKLASSSPRINFKSRFQEWALSAHKQVPEYTIIDQSGPDHAREFVAEVRVGDRKYGEGKGRKKQAAEKEAARHALISLGLVAAIPESSEE